MSITMIQVPCPLCGGNEQVRERELRGFQLVRCRGCSFVYANPRHTEEALAELYTNKPSDHYVELYAKIATPTLIASYQQTISQLEELLPGRGRLLDVGCGAGYFFEQAQQRGWDAHGVDLGSWAADAAASRGLQNLHVGRLSDLQFPDGYFDVIYSAQMFEHLSEPRQELADIQRLLRPGGLLYVDVPNYHTLPILLGRDDFMLNTPPQHINYFTSRTLRRLLETGGFKDVRITTSSGLKWENLLGRPIHSEIAAAYDLGSSASPAGDTTAKPSSPPVGRSLLSTAKSLLRTTVIRPVFYQALQVGMLLVSTSRRP